MHDAYTRHGACFFFFICSYTQEIPSRFKKEIVHAAGNGLVEVDGLQRVIDNIGASQAISHQEIIAIFAELGENGQIPAHKMMELF